MKSLKTFDLETEVIMLNEMAQRGAKYTKSFGDQMLECLEANGITTPLKFVLKTNLHDSTYKKLRRDPDGNYELEVILTICAALDLDIDTTNRLLEAAGHVLRQSLYTHLAYKTLFTRLIGQTYNTKNEFLRSVGVKELGSKTYRERD